MRLLKIVIKNTAFFKDDIVISFDTSDGVRNAVSDNDNTMQAYKIRKGLYSQVLLSFIGLNATGKTTILEIISSILKILIEYQSLKEASIHNMLNKLSLNGKSNIEWEIYFLNDTKIYLLKSLITFNQNNRLFEYAQEDLYSTTLNYKLKNKELFDFITLDDVIHINRQKENTPYLKKDLSISMSLPEHNERVYALENTVNLNLPYWHGRPYQELINCFDSNIEELTILSQNDKNTTNLSQATLKFKNQSKIYNGRSDILIQLLSSGTIKGLSILPAIIDVLSNGGYIIIDELENHFNKKIIEWFLELFNDKRTNPHGACLIFSTHYPEILDCFARKDNINVMIKNDSGYIQCIRYSDKIKRNEILKSNILLSNIINGTAPSYINLLRAKNYLIDKINSQLLEEKVV